MSILISRSLSSPLFFYKETTALAVVEIRYQQKLRIKVRVYCFLFLIAITIHFSALLSVLYYPQHSIQSCLSDNKWKKKKIFFLNPKTAYVNMGRVTWMDYDLMFVWSFLHCSLRWIEVIKKCLCRTHCERTKCRSISMSSTYEQWFALWKSLTHDPNVWELTAAIQPQQEGKLLFHTL